MSTSEERTENRSSDVWADPAPPGASPGGSQTRSLPKEAALDPAALLPRRGSARAVGTVANLKQRIETHRRLPTAQIVNFRLERYDQRGNRLQPIPVEMRGMTISGYLADGERVRVTGRFHDGTLYTKKVENVTTGGGISTQASGRLGRRLGRPAEIILIVLLLAVAATCVRFIPQVYINTPMGLHEYESEVHSTCERLAQISQANLPLSFDSVGSVPREQVLEGFEGKVAATDEAYALLLSHNTPIIRRSRRDRVASTLPLLKKYFADLRVRLEALPAAVPLNELTAVGADLEAEAARVSASQGDAMTQLAGGTCHVN